MRRTATKQVCISAFAAALGFAAAPSRASACAPVSPPDVAVDIADESAIIVWDAAHRQEHFIRRAAFRTTANDFGFLVPTPTKPDLTEVADRAFQQLDEHVKPATVREHRVSGVMPVALCLGLFLVTRSAAPAAAPEVRVLEARRVGGYDAVVLQADDPTALAHWLAKHGYANRPELARWLEPYVSAKWMITAFKIPNDRDASAIETAAVQMTFTTDRPFFPYREPADARDAPAQPGRLLRVFFIGTERVDGFVGAGPWPGAPIWSDRLLLAPPDYPVPAQPWLTMFEDRSSPRPGTDDLFFAPATDRTAVKPPARVITISEPMPIPIDVLGLLGVGGWWLWRKRRVTAAPPTA